MQEPMEVVLVILLKVFVLSFGRAGGGAFGRVGRQFVRIFGKVSCGQVAESKCEC